MTKHFSTDALPNDFYQQMSRGNPLLDRMGNEESKTIVTTTTPHQNQHVTKTVTTTTTNNVTSSPRNYTMVNNVLPMYKEETTKGTSLNLNPGGSYTKEVVLNIGGGGEQKTTSNVMSSSSQQPWTQTTKIIDVPATTNLNASATNFKGISS